MTVSSFFDQFGQGKCVLAEIFPAPLSQRDRCLMIQLFTDAESRVRTLLSGSHHSQNGILLNGSEKGHILRLLELQNEIAEYIGLPEPLNHN